MNGFSDWALVAIGALQLLTFIKEMAKKNETNTAAERDKHEKRHADNEKEVEVLKTKVGGLVETVAEIQRDIKKILSKISQLSIFI